MVNDITVTMMYVDMSVMLVLQTDIINIIAEITLKIYVNSFICLFSFLIMRLIFHQLQHHSQTGGIFYYNIWYVYYFLALQVQYNSSAMQKITKPNI